MKTIASLCSLAALLLVVACSENGPNGPTDDTLSAPPAGKFGKADSAFADPDDTLWATIQARCGRPAEDEAVIYSNDFHWGYDRDTMAARFDEMYASDKRLADRAYFDDETGNFVMKTVDSWGGEVVLPTRLVENVTIHIERAKALGYADHVFFPDMGHSHFFIPQEHWDEKYSAAEISEFADRNSQMLDDPELKVLYHTAEQLEMLDDEDRLLDDPWVQWRFHTRNVVGDNDWKARLELLRDFESKANTSRDYPGHHYFGAGFNISANKNGCFPYEEDGEVFWYDISLSDLPYEVTSGDGGFF